MYRMSFSVILLISALLAGACRKDSGTDILQPTPYELSIPGGLPPMVIPANNPLTREGVALGRKLFYDPILSADSSQSCASCHRQNWAFVDSSLRFSIGITGESGVRNAMPLFNLGWQDNFFWDGGAADLESQVLGPITNPLEMNEELGNVLLKLNRHPEYPALFRAAFALPDTAKVTIPLMMRAVAQFERTIISGDSRYDRWKRGQGQLNEQELRGLTLFENPEKGDCNHCHVTGSTFSDFAFRNNGLNGADQGDQGRYRITLLDSDRGKFKTPSLRNIELTAPYMHDGRFQTLDEVLEFYNSGVQDSPTLDPNLKHADPGRMSAQDKADIIAFLKTLSDPALLSNPDFSAPQ